MHRMDTTKRDMVLVYGGRTFAVRAYHDGARIDVEGPGWRSVIIENGMPLVHEQITASGPEGCFAEAARFVAGIVEADAIAKAGAAVGNGRSSVPRVDAAATSS